MKIKLILTILVFVASINGLYSNQKDLLASSLISALHLKSGIEFEEINENTLLGIDLGDIELFDIDGDDDLDLVMMGYRENISVSKIYQNDGKGNFTEINEDTLLGLHWGSMVFGDIDNDDDFDLIISGEDSSENYVSKVYINDSKGNFSEQQNSTIIGAAGGSSTLTDIDGDNDIDFILSGITSSLEYITKIYQNDGAGNFTEINEGTITGIWQSSMDVGDIDGDGDDDLIISGNIAEHEYPNILTKVYINDGAGNFTDTQQDVIGGVRWSSLFLSDMDNDNDLDLLIAGDRADDSGSSKIYINDGAGNFTERDSTLANVDGRLAIGDIDGDSYVDVILTSDKGNSSKVYKNDGLAVFVDTKITTLDIIETGAIKLGDIDGDNKIDLILTGDTVNGAISKIYKNISK